MVTNVKEHKVYLILCQTFLYTIRLTVSNNSIRRKETIYWFYWNTFHIYYERSFRKFTRSYQKYWECVKRRDLLKHIIIMLVRSGLKLMNHGLPLNVLWRIGKVALSPSSVMMLIELLHLSSHIYITTSRLLYSTHIREEKEW